MANLVAEHKKIVKRSEWPWLPEMMLCKPAALVCSLCIALQPCPATMYSCPTAGSKLARPLVIAGTVAAGAAAYGNRDKHAAGPLAVAAAVNGAAIALTLFLLKPLEAEIEVRGMNSLHLMDQCTRAPRAASF